MARLAKISTFATVMIMDMKYMRRALQLARLGEFGASPNPMVGAVIVDDATGRIVGEGFHRRCGEGHAEVNAVADADRRGVSLDNTTLYVTLEPCAHHGKTPPCAQLIIDRGIPRVAVGCADPFARVAGRGIAMMREAGVEVARVGGEMERECLDINRKFMTAHTHGRPFVTLKWAMSADGFIDRIRSAGEVPARFSLPHGQVLVHRERALHDAIAVGSRTEIMDRPRLDVRHWPGGRVPRRVCFDRVRPLDLQLADLYAEGVTSLLVEGGATLAGSFLDAGLWDEIRTETSPMILGDGVPAPRLPVDAVEISCMKIGPNALKTYKNGLN